MMSENKKIFLAIENARAKGFSELKKSGTNPAFKSKYSTLQDVFDACKKPLEENGVHISFTTDAIIVDDRVENILVCRLLHLESGEMLESKVSCLDDTKKGSQAIGSGISYMRRYLLQAMLNLECDPETDDDGDATTVTPKSYMQLSSPDGKTSKEEYTHLKDISEKMVSLLDLCKTEQSVQDFWRANIGEGFAIYKLQQGDEQLFQKTRVSFNERRKSLEAPK